MDMNNVVLVGRLTVDPEVRHTQSGFQITNFTIANNQRKKNQAGVWEDKPSFYTVKMLGDNYARTIDRLSKGMRVGFIGQLDMDKWEKDGVVNTKTVVLARSLQVFDKLEKQEVYAGDFGSAGASSDDDLPF